jgi:hypothetical protein
VNKKIIKNESKIFDGCRIRKYRRINYYYNTVYFGMQGERRERERERELCSGSVLVL